MASATMHVILYPPYLIGILPKDRMSFQDSFVDARNWTADDLVKHPVVVKRILSAGKTHWLTHVAKEADISTILEKGPAATQPGNPATHPALPVRNLGIK